jgi:hypothetical protein
MVKAGSFWLICEFWHIGTRHALENAPGEDPRVPRYELIEIKPQRWTLWQIALVTTMEHIMSGGEMGYLALVLGAATLFGLVLAYYSSRAH